MGTISATDHIPLKDSVNNSIQVDSLQVISRLRKNIFKEEGMKHDSSDLLLKLSKKHILPVVNDMMSGNRLFQFNGIL